MNSEELDHFYSFYSSPINDLFKEFQETTRAANLRLFHDQKDSSELFWWLSDIIYFQGGETNEPNQSEETPYEYYEVI